LDGIRDSMKRKLLPGFLGGFKGSMEGFWPEPKVDDLKIIGEWMKEGKVKAVIDEKFKFEDVVQAFRKLKTGRARVKIVIDIASESNKL